MKDNVKVSTAIIFIITIIILSIIPLTVQSVTFENEYGKLEVYPDISCNIIRQKQFFNATSYLPSQDLDIAFRFNNSLTYGGVYYYNGSNYNKIDVEHIEYNNKHWYLLNDIYFEQDETKQGFWEYDTPINSSGKWDMFIKRSSDTLQYALENNLYVHLDPWWNSSWAYQNNTYVCNAVEDYSVHFNLSYTDFFNSNCQSDFDDIRWVGDNTTELYYYYYDKVNSDYITGFVNISNFDRVSIYYGNVIVSESVFMSGIDTFIFFEPFENLDDWTIIQNPVDSGAVFNINSNRLYADDNTHDAMLYSDAFGYTNGIALELFDVDMTDIGNNQIQLNPDVAFGSEDDYTRYLSYDVPDEDTVGNMKYVASTEEIFRDNEGESLHYQRMMIGIDENRNTEFIIDETNKGLSSNVLDSEDWRIRYYISDSQGTSEYYIDGCAIRLYRVTEPTFCNWTGEIEQPAVCECIVSNPNPVNLSTGVEWANLNLSVLVNSSLGCDIDYVNISMNNGSYLYYFNWSVGGYSNGTFYYNTTFNLSSATEYIVWFNASCNGTQNNTWVTFTTFGVSLDDLYNLQIYMNNKIIGVDDELDINIGLDGTLLTLVLFAVFFVVGYTINKRSGGILMIFSGFTLIAFEFLVSSVLNAFLVIPLLSPIAILIIVLGVRKWLYPVENEKTKSEGT